MKPAKNENLERLTGIVEDAIGLLSKDDGYESPAAPSAGIETTPSPKGKGLGEIRCVEKFNFSDECAFSQSSEIGEKFREIRTNIYTLSKVNKINTYVLTSCHHNEGKTHLAINTARFLAQYEGSRVLLIDGDMRRPRIYKRVSADYEFGLEDYLTNKCRLEDALMYSKADNLTVLPSLKGRSSATEMLESDRMNHLMEVARVNFDYVLVDCSPVLSTTDPLVIGPKADGVLITVKSGAVQRDSVEHAIGLMRQANARVVGVVLTQVKDYLPSYLHRYNYFSDVYPTYYYKAGEVCDPAKTTGKKRRWFRRG